IFLFCRLFKMQTLFKPVIPNGAFDAVDVEWLVETGPVASALAGVRAHPARDGGKRVSPGEDFPGIVKGTPVGYDFEVFPNVDTRGTVELACRRLKCRGFFSLG